MTDEALMLAVRDGDLGKLGALFERYHVPLFDFLSRTTGDRAAAEDLVQDVFVRILKYRQTYRDGGRFETWVFRIARNAKADHFRSRRNIEPLREEDFEVASSTPGPAQEFERAQQTTQVRRALMRLDDETRDLLVLARYQGMSYDRIGALLDIQANAVKVRVHRALKELRAVFERLEDEDRTCNAKKSGTDWRII